jgi:hypothetical protein
LDVDFVDEHRARKLLFDGDDRDLAAVLTVVLEANLARHFCEEGVVLAEPDVQPGFEPATLLTDEDGATRNEVAVMPFHAEPLRIAVAAVT